jgi:hypothetical protein
MNRSATPLLLVALLAAADLASAAVPSPANSTLPDCLVLGPLGDIPFTVTIRDLANNPIAGASVVISFEGCTGNVHVCPQLPTDPYDVNPALPSIRRSSDATGMVTFPVRVGGTGPLDCAAVFASGVLMRRYALASPDQDGDGRVIPALGYDAPILAGKLGTVDPTADFDCSGGPVDAADQAIFGQHPLHNCDSIGNPVTRHSWGSLKLHFR